MRLCYYNPQVCLGKTTIGLLLNSPPSGKYLHLLDYLKDSRYDTAIIVDGTATSLNASSQALKILSNNYFLVRVISFFEIYIWCFLNGIKPSRRKIIFNSKKLDNKNDVIFGLPFLIDTFVNSNMIEKCILKDFEGSKVFHFSHYFTRTGIISDSLRKFGVVTISAEVDIRHSEYFKKYFSFVKRLHILPFIVRERYKNQVDFFKRKDKCFAVGSEPVLSFISGESDLDYKDYIEFYKTPVLHPARKLIYDNRDTLRDIIDCYISPIFSKNIKNSRNRLLRTLKKILFQKFRKDRYFSFNIVDKYNEYKIFVAPEENVGVPSVNFVEGMACGSAYLGLIHPMYEGLGLINGVNYIGYDGTLEDMRRKIEYYINHQEELEKIAKNGEELVRGRFSKEKVVSDLWVFMDSLNKDRS